MSAHTVAESHAEGLVYLLQCLGFRVNQGKSIWNISWRDTETRSFRRKLPHSCLSHGGLRPTDLTTHSLVSGIAGVVQGIRIPFQVL